MRVAGLGYSDGARNLEVMLESLSGGGRREIQEDGIVTEVKNILFFYFILFIYLFYLLILLFSINEIEHQYEDKTTTKVKR